MFDLLHQKFGNQDSTIDNVDIQMVLLQNHPGLLIFRLRQLDCLC
jgi:hypothetical protein